MVDKCIHDPVTGGAVRIVEAMARIQLRNILFSTDFSPNTQVALQYAMAVARRFESRLFLAHVIPTDSYRLAPPQDAQTVSQWVRREAEEQMAALMVTGILRDVPHQVLLGEGSLWPTLAGMIDENEIDLIVAATHGRAGVGKLFLGSVAEEIFRHAKCPVMTVGPHTSSSAPREANFRRIIYATDFSAHSQHAAAYAFALAQEFQAHITLLHVVREVTDPSAESIGGVREALEDRLRLLVPPEAELWCKPEVVVGFREPAEMIRALAETRQAELIVLGVRGEVRFAGHRPAGTAYKVVCNAPCPVLTVKGQDIGLLSKSA
jgi:nucleotide-binding universal stress UspA family protein